jgi:DNA (cytosine-5)-methyltransferase 1
MNVVDFFSGCGGASCGFRRAGLNIIVGIDSNKNASETFALNFPEATIFNTDIRSLSPLDLEPKISNNPNSLLFSACTPCQPFSKQNRHKKQFDERIDLLGHFSRFIEHFLPDYIFIENVPGLRKYLFFGAPLENFTNKLSQLGYPEPSIKNIYAIHYGVPQWRPRLIIIASRHSKLHFPQPTHGLKNGSPNFSTVREWIGDLPPLKAGERSKDDEDHESARLSSLNIERIRNTPEGGNRDGWPLRLRLKCHLRMLSETGKEGHSDVYGRLCFDKPASGLTTRCLSYSNGRFGHPTQDRAISLREAACLQTFPRDFRFTGALHSKACQVGNAVPPLLAETFGKHFLSVEDARLSRQSAISFAGLGS